jgi:hypothetical protein
LYHIAECEDELLDEFAIYLSYVRKLGFEETPDYDFLRELFAKVMKNNNDIDDGLFDWSLLNGQVLWFSTFFMSDFPSGGKGWESSVVSKANYFTGVQIFKLTDHNLNVVADPERRSLTQSTRPSERHRSTAPRHRPTTAITTGRHCSPFSGYCEGIG